MSPYIAAFLMKELPTTRIQHWEQWIRRSALTTAPINDRWSTCFLSIFIPALIYVDIPTSGHCDVFSYSTVSTIQACSAKNPEAAICSKDYIHDTENAGLENNIKLPPQPIPFDRG